MLQSARLVETLKKCLRTRGKTYADVARALGLSEPSIKRMFSRGTFTLRRVEEILDLLEMELFEAARMSRGMREGPAELALEQETALAKDERLLSVFWLLLNEWRFGEILEAYSIGRKELTLAFARLARLKLIDWGPA